MAQSERFDAEHFHANFEESDTVNFSNGMVRAIQLSLLVEGTAHQRLQYDTSRYWSTGLDHVIAWNSVLAQRNFQFS